MKHILKYFRKNTYNIGAISVFIITQIIYLITLNHFNPGYADSDEIITTAYLLGNAHPPGYPILIIIIKLFTLLPIPGSIAFRANLANSLLQSFATVFVYLISIEIIKNFKIFKSSNLQKQIKLKYTAVAIASATALITAFSTMVWLYAVVTEVYALNNFLATLTIYLALKWSNETLKYKDKITKFEWKLFLATGFFAGLGTTHVQSFLLIFPALLILLILTLKENKKYNQYFSSKLFWLAISILIGFSIQFFLLFLINLHKADMSWYFQNDIKGIIRQIQRQDYSGFFVEKDQNLTAYLGGGINPKKYLNDFLNYFNLLSIHYIYIGIFIGIIGFIWSFFYNKKIFYTIASLYFFQGIFIAIYLGFPELETAGFINRMTLGVHQRQYILGEIIWGFAILLGFIAIFDIWYKYNKKNIQKSTFLIYILLFTMTIMMLLTNWDTTNQKNNDYAHKYATEILNNVDKDSVVICMADLSCFSLLYQSLVENYRPDVTVLTKNPKYQRYFLEKHPEYAKFLYFDNPNYVADILATNLGKRSVYITDAQSFYINKLGLNGNPFFLIPEGYAYKIDTKVPEEVPGYNYQYTKDFLAKHKSKNDYWLNGVQDYLSNFHNITGIIYSYFGDKITARENFNLAVALNGNPQSKQFLSDLVAYPGNPQYTYGVESSSSAQISKLAYKYIDQKEDDKAYYEFLKVLNLDPLNIQDRFEVAELLKKGGYFKEALIEYKNILKLNPNHATASARIKFIEDRLSY